MSQTDVERSCTGFEVTLHDPGIAVVTFNQPDRLNLATVGLKRDLLEFLAFAQMSDAVRVVVLTGEGRAFCAGDDLRAYEAHQATTVPTIEGGHETPIRTVEGLRTFSQALTRALRDFDKPTIAGVNGLAIQLGLSMSLACDYRVASTTAKFGHPVLRFGFLPDDGGHYLLVEFLGPSRALEFLMHKRIVDAQAALELGLVGELVEPAELMDRTMTLARELAAGPQVAMRMLKRALFVAAESSFERACEDIAVRTAIVEHHSDAHEGKAAFQEKREARFNAELGE